MAQLGEDAPGNKDFQSFNFMSSHHLVDSLTARGDVPLVNCTTEARGHSGAMTSWPSSAKQPW